MNNGLIIFFGLYTIISAIAILILFFACDKLFDCWDDVNVILKTLCEWEMESIDDIKEINKELEDIKLKYNSSYIQKIIKAYDESKNDDLK